VEIEDFAISKTLVDQDSSVDILYWDTFKKLRISKVEIQQYSEPIMGFSGERVNTKGYIDLFTKFGAGRTTRTVKIRYLIVDAHTSYNIFLGRPSLNMLGAVISTYHLAIKFLSISGDIVTVHVDQPTARKCYADSLRERPIHQVESPAPLQYQNQTQVFSPGKSSVTNDKCCPETRWEVLAQLSRIPHKGRNPVTMKMEGTVPDETSPEYKPPPTKQKQGPEQPDATPSWTGSWKWNFPRAERGWLWTSTMTLLIRRSTWTPSPPKQDCTLRMTQSSVVFSQHP